MSPERLPEAVLLDPESGALPAGLDAPPGEAPPVLLLVAPDTGDPAARTAIALAEARARAGYATILADASGDPRLHILLDVDNTEGLADVLLYGVSPGRVRTRPPARPFEFIPVGPYLPDDPSVLDSDRWTGIATALDLEDESMLLFVPSGTPGLAALSRRFWQAVLIGDPGSVERSAARLDPACEVMAVIEPVGGMDPERLAAVAGTPTDAEAETIFDRPGPEEPLVAARGKERRAVSPVLWVLLAATLALAAWYVYDEYFADSTGSVPEADAPAEVDAGPEAMAPAGPRGDPVDVPIPISVAVEAHQDLSAANQRLITLQAAEPAIGFFLAPIDLDGVVYYRLLAGSSVDQEAGEALMQQLVEAGHKTASDPWAIRSTPYAFLLGEYDTAGAASARADSLAGLQVPSYVVTMPYDTGPPRFRVYGGAYESENEAALMGQRLTEAGIEAELVTRTGEPVGT